MLRFKVDVLAELKNTGLTQLEIKKQGLTWRMYECFQKDTLPPGWKSLDAVCKMLNRQPGYFLEYDAGTKKLFFYYDIIELLRNKGITNAAAMKNGLSGGTRQLISQGEVPPSWHQIGILCSILKTTPAKLLEWMPD